MDMCFWMFNKRFLRIIILFLTVFHISETAFAEGPDITVGGFSSFITGTTNQKNEYRIDADSRDTKFMNDNEIFIAVTDRSDSGLVYGAEIDLEADVTADTLNQGLNAHKTFIFLESSVGRVEMGSVFGPARMMKIDASTISRGFGGVEGDWSFFSNVLTVGAGNYIVVPELPLDYGTVAYGVGDAENSTKISYYTPEYKGFQFGVAYSPDSGSRGTAAAFNTNTNDPRFFENIAIVGATYKASVQDINIATSFGGQFGNAENRNREDLNAYSLGASINYAKFTIGGSYSDWGKTGSLKIANKKGGDYWSLGASYVDGPVGTSIGYFSSSREGNDVVSYVWGIDYALAPGLTPFGEVAVFGIDPENRSISKNTGTVVILGTLLNF